MKRRGFLGFLTGGAAAIAGAGRMRLTWAGECIRQRRILDYGEIVRQTLMARRHQVAANILQTNALLRRLQKDDRL